jgi:eukaryotic-like serine/threonine-protein kinase
LRISNSITADSRPEVQVDIVPPPLCRSLLEFDSMRTSSLAADGLEARLLGGSALREGDPIRIEVKAGKHPINVRIDYFSISGEVLHMMPTGAVPIARLPAGARRTFESGGAGKEWLAGGAPFGTELVAVIATPNPLDLDKRPEVERAPDYLRALEKALQHSRTNAPGPNLVSTILVHTSAR